MAVKSIPTRRGVEPSTPAWIKPELAALVKDAPDGPDWLHEIKLDGYRMHARLDGGKVQILTRRGNDWTDKYPAIVKAISRIGDESPAVILDESLDARKFSQALRESDQENERPRSDR